MKYLRVCVAAGGLVVLAGCLPEDTIIRMEFAPGGRFLAVVSEKEGLRIIDVEQERSTAVQGGRVDGARVAWIGDEAVAYGAAPEGTFDVFISRNDGVTTRVSSFPSKETSPMVWKDSLLYLTTESGVSELTSYSLSGETEGLDLRLPECEAGMVNPALSPDGRRMAYYTFEDLKPRLYVANLETGAQSAVEDGADLFGLMPGELSWGPDSRALAYVRGLPATAGKDSDEEEDGGETRSAGGRQLVVWHEAGERRVVAEGGEVGLRWPRLFGRDGIVYVKGDKLHLGSIRGGDTEQAGKGAGKELGLDLAVSLPAVNEVTSAVAFVVADQLLGVTSGTLDEPRILMLSLEDKFLLAEEYFRTGSSGKSYSLYEELAASVTRTRDPEMARFVYIANLRRLGKTRQAVAELERLLEDRGTSQTVPQEVLWRTLGYSYLLELNDLERAELSFRRYVDLTSDTVSVMDPDSAVNALQILRQTGPEVARLYGRAVKARLDGNFPLTNQLFGELLTTAPLVGGVRREYINALDGFDEEVYFFSPSQRPFKPSKAERAAYLQRFVDTVSSGSVLLAEVRLDLFLLLIEMGDYGQARGLLTEALTSAPETGRPEGILEVFRNYLETPEPQPWINAAMPAVFWHPDVRGQLEPLLQDSEDRLLTLVAATKMALLEGNADAAREQANAAGAEWSRLKSEEQQGDVAELYGRLLVYRAREAELRGLYAEAATGYDQALKLLEEKQASNFEMQEEIRYRAALLRLMVADYPEMVDRLRRVEEWTGVELVNPTWNREALMSGAREFARLYDSTTSTLKLWAAYEAGVCFGKLRMQEQARAALLLAGSDAAPAFLQRKAMVELAALDEYGGDPWNASRWFARIAALPGTGEQTRLWCSYQIARLNISMGYKVSAAREALGVIVSTRPESDLAVFAQELLINTSVR